MGALTGTPICMCLLLCPEGPLNESELASWFSGPGTVERIPLLRHERLTADYPPQPLNATAFLPWNRMGNMQGWGGPLTLAWHEQQRTLQTYIVTRSEGQSRGSLPSPLYATFSVCCCAVRIFGMTPVLPGFAGHVPRSLAAHYPGHNFTDSPDCALGGAGDTTCTCDLPLSLSL